jgi:hypothetical protein
LWASAISRAALRGVTSCWNTPLARALNGMKPSTDIETKLRIGWALSDRLAPVACTIVKNITTSTKMIDDLPSTAIEAMLDYSKEQHRLDRPRTPVERAYKDVRQALITYGEVALREARERERRLLHGITGRHPRAGMKRSERPTRPF